MALEKQRMYRKNIDGTKDLIYRETSSDIVKYKDINVETAIDNNISEIKSLDLIGDNFLTQTKKVSFESWNLENTKHTDIYSLYDNLVANNSDVMSGVVWGTDKNGKQLKYYVIKPKFETEITKEVADNIYQNNNSKPQYILSSGVHGNEKVAVQSLYLFIKEMLERRTSLDCLQSDNYQYVIMPICNPHGFDNNIRTNPNNVDINRNFPTGWDSETSSDKGTSPLSEKESQFMLEVTNTFTSNFYEKNGTIVADFHNHYYKLHQDKRVFWTGSNFYYLRQELINHISYAKRKVGEVVPELLKENTGASNWHFSSLVTSSSFINHANTLGLKSFFAETPISVENEVYPFKLQKLSYLYCSSLLPFISKYVGVQNANVYTTLKPLGCTVSNTLDELVLALPNGSSLNFRISSESTLLSCMPDKGMLTIIKSATVGSKQATITLQTVTKELTQLYVCSRTDTGLTVWQKVGKSVFGSFKELGLNSTTATMQNVIDKLPSGSIFTSRILSSYTGIYSSLPQYQGVLTINKTNYSSSQCVLEYITSDSNFKVFKNYWYGSSGLRTWKEILTS